MKNTDPAANRPVLIVLGAGERDDHAFTLQQIASAHAVLLMDSDPPAWTWPYTVAAWSIDLQDHTAVAAAVTQTARERGVAGVMTYTEHHIPLAARLAEDLGLPNASASAMNVCRDKALTHRLLDEHHVPSARSYRADNEKMAVERASRLGYPVVVKPRGMSSSAGVLRADSDNAVRRAFETASEATTAELDAYAIPGTLVEEYLPGPEISVECLVLTGRDVRIVAITRKRLGPEPRFLPSGHGVAADDELMANLQVRDVATHAVRAVGIALGPVQVKMRLTPRGPAVIGVNGRLGGDHLALLVHLATGVSIPRAAAELAVGRTPDLTPTRHQCAAVQFLYLDAPGQITRQQIRAYPNAWLERFVWTAPVGASVDAPGISTTDRVAHCVVTAPRAETCDLRLLLMEDLVTVETAPAAAAGAR
ncbi:ATP-grasp domain-containing protein [Streptomyces sp. NEAU-S7GS2]|uniref:ATP-grasp domain-containing protein n=1 Tax=Streptomyces sp. NEAU-S7GS2 TaxID=2202000 RepID=UPI0013A52D8E|nr:ATP-grasp domain-containing protein [Streptomyces sp. NEAU-S7GS2]